MGRYGDGQWTVSGAVNGIRSANPGPSTVRYLGRVGVVNGSLLFMKSGGFDKMSFISARKEDVGDVSVLVERSLEGKDLRKPVSELPGSRRGLFRESEKINY